MVCTNQQKPGKKWFSSAQKSKFHRMDRAKERADVIFFDGGEALSYCLEKFICTIVRKLFFNFTIFTCNSIFFIVK